MKRSYFEDIEVGQKNTAGEYRVTKEEVLEFARKWDPQPFHIDEEKAKSTQFGGLIASASHTMAMSFWLLNRAGKGLAASSGAGWDKMQLPNPVRPDDRLSLAMECIEKRESKSKLDRGILRHAVVITNQDKLPVCTFETLTIVKKRSKQKTLEKHPQPEKLRFFEEIELNKKEKMGEYRVSEEEVIEFGKKWDPQPFHIDKEAAKAFPYGGIIAPNGYTMSIITLLAAQSDLRMATIGLLGYDELRFPNPVRPGDLLTMTSECIEKRESKSNSNNGIIRAIVEMANQNGQPVLTSESAFIVARKPR